MLGSPGRRFSLFFVLILLATLAARAQEESLGFAELLAKTVNLDSLYQPPNHRIKVFSSYDRSGGDQDDTGFLRREGEVMVIAEMKGPGALTRIGSGNPRGTIRIYLDGSDTPAVECPFAELFSGKVQPFLKPFVREGKNNEGAYSSYVPIPFEISLKITLDRHCYYQIECAAFPADAPARTLNLPLDKKTQNLLSEIGKRFHVNDAMPLRSGKKTKDLRVAASLAAGERIGLATFAGPAVIRGLRLKWEGDKDETGRELILRIYWDGEKKPSVETPLYDLLGGPGRTLALGKEKNGWRYFYLPMPFSSSAVIELENGSESTASKLETVFLLEENAELPFPLRTLHAMWNRDNETRIDRVTLLPSSGEPVGRASEAYQALSIMGRGHWVGMSMLRTGTSDSDGAIFVDQVSEEPAYPDTGNDGFFDATGSTATGNWPLSSVMRSINGGDHLVRAFLYAPVEFSQGILISLEHGSGNTRRQDYSCTNFWYQDEPHEPYPPLPPVGLRRFRTTPLIQPILQFLGDKTLLEAPYEAEAMTLAAMGGLYETQDMTPFGPDWSGNQQLRYEALGEDSALHLTLPPVSYSGLYHLEFQLTVSPDGGIYQIRLDDETVADPVDLYEPKTGLKTLRIPTPVFLHASEQPLLIFKSMGKQEESGGMAAGLDFIQLLPQSTSPKELSIQGPFRAVQDATHSEWVTVPSMEGDVYPLGFGQNKPATDWKPKKDSGLFHLADIAAHSSPRDLYWTSWEVQAAEPGIYRFELDPFSVTPFLLGGETAPYEMEYRRILINGIVLRGEETVRYDPVERKVLPLRFHVPLNRGDNRISWMIQGGDTALQPRLYGLPQPAANESR